MGIAIGRENCYNPGRCMRHSRVILYRKDRAASALTPSAKTQREDRDMRKYLLSAALVVVTLAVTLSSAQPPAFAQAARSADPIFGKWMMDQTKSVNNRRGDHATFPTQHVRILAPESDGLRNTLANSPTSAPEYSYSAKFDGKDHPDPRFPGKDQTLAHWHIAPDVIVRLQKTDGKTSEWVIYTVSSDGKMFTSISWAPSNPELQDVQVFTRGN